jgi:hypothetical protein
MRPTVYYHIWAPEGGGLWKLMVDEQLKRLYRSGLSSHATVKCAIGGAQAPQIREFVSLYEWVNVIECRHDDTEYEGLTLKHLYDDCVSGRVEKLMYFHTKGMSHFCESTCSDRRFRAVNSWRHFLEWGCIDKWKDNIDKLDRYQVSGVNYLSEPWPHMSGNFWWARADYIAGLQHPTKERFQVTPQDFGHIERLNFEKWIGMNRPSVFSFYSAPTPYGCDVSTMVPDVPPAAGDPRSFWLYRDDIYPHYLKHA